MDGVTDGGLTVCVTVGTANAFPQELLYLAVQTPSPLGNPVHTLVAATSNVRFNVVLPARFPPVPV